MTVSATDIIPLVPTTKKPTYEANAPRAVAVLNGVPYQVSAYTISLNAHGASDTATVVIPISSNPDFTVEFFKSPNDQAPVFVEIYAGFPSNINVSLTDISQLSRRFLGIVDMYSAKFASNELTFNCRSIAAPLIDTPITTYSQNQTTIQFVAAMADSIGLKTSFNIANPPVTLQSVLGYDNIGGAGFAATVYRMKIWDLILRSAQVDDVDVWVDSTPTLHYEAPWLVKRNTVALDWLRDFDQRDGLEATHSIQFSKNIQVEVYTYQRKTRITTGVQVTSVPGGGTTVSQSSRTSSSSIIPGTNETIQTSTSSTGAVSQSVSSGSGGAFRGSASQAAGESGKERYVFYVRNVSPQVANQMALAKWRQISMHEYAITGKLPMTEALLKTLSITSLIKLGNTPYSFVNDLYWPRTIDEDFNISGGWTLAMHCVNHTPPNQSV
jgi:hypothetical protein